MQTHSSSTDPQEISTSRTPSDATGRDRQNQRRIQLWSFLWMLTWLGVNAAIRFDYLAPGALALSLTMATSILGLVVLMAYVRFLRDTDELRRKIEVEALALAYGVGLVGLMTLFLIQRSGYLSEMDLLAVALLMMFTYTIGQWRGRKYYA